MCGIAGAFFSTRQAEPIADTLGRMNTLLAHRGPDEQGIYVDSRLGFGFGHTRLSIVDPSKAGAQPIWSKNGLVVATFNGEIYNHHALRASLASEGHEVLWEGHSDSETLVELLATWGPKATLPKLLGMFGFASFDFRSQTLTIARDRAGEKPLYFGQAAGKWGFASELSALEALFGDDLVLNERGLSHYMSRSYLPEEHSIYEQIKKLSPGTFLSLRLSDIISDELPLPVSYWRPPNSNEFEPKPSSLGGRRGSHVSELNRLLTNSIESQLQADVPVGTFLSGGIDSTLVTAIAKRIDVGLKTFSLGFESSCLDEAPFAKQVSKALGTVHSEIYTTNAEMVEIATGLADSLDEPFADSSSIPTYILSRFAKEKVSVILTGDGGDELFGGYPRYRRARKLARVLALPAPVREQIARTIESIPYGWIQRSLSPISILDGSRFGDFRLERKIRRYLPLLRAASELDLYQGLISSRGMAMLRNPEHTKQIDSKIWRSSETIEEAAALFDFLTFLPGDILHKVDRTAMAHGLETRAPLLDACVMDFAYRLHRKRKFSPRHGKVILRQLLQSYIPANYWDRPKSGFSMPMAELLRKDLKDWASELVFPSFSKYDALFNYDVIAQMWAQHLSADEDFSTELWNFLMLSSWLKRRRPSLGSKG
jgi:asparagine synthase (glutamine-hydrolysing)